ncbi:MAG: hypothetical protein Q7S59_06600, partial [Sulfurimonas sp.]|nr:hypothetical protein [Sulfurimonas sp.]
GNAISMSNGQKDMKINEEGLDWNKVFESVKNGFQNNMKQEHTEEMGDKYKTYLNSTSSESFFYSDAQKETMFEQYKKDNYELNSSCFNAAEYFLSK